MLSGCVAARRAAEAMVQQLGDAQALLELPMPPVAGDEGEQLGLRAPEFQQRVLAPVAVRPTKNAVEVLVAAEVLEELLSVRGEGAVAAAARAVYAVVIGDVRYRLTGVEAMRAMGGTCLYRMLLGQAGTEVV